MMKGKKILYSAWLKAVAFAVCVVTAAAVAGEVCKAVSEMRGGSGYRPGEAFEENDVLLSSLGSGAQMLADVITDESGNRVFDRTWLDVSGLEYYAENLETGRVITNSGNKDKSYYATGEFPGMYTYLIIEKRNGEFSLDGNEYALTRNALSDSYMYEYDEYTYENSDMNTEYSDGYIERSQNRQQLDDYVVYLKLNDTKASELLTLWQRAQILVDGALREIPAYAAVFMLALVYLSFAAGRRAGDNEIHMMAIDRVFLDITALIMAAAFILSLFGVAIFIEVPPDDDIYRRYSMLAAGAGSAVIVTCWLSIVKHIKDHTLVQRSIICRAVRWAWRLCVRVVKWVFVKLPKKIKGAYAALKELAAENMSHMMLLAAAAVFMVITVLFSWLTGALLYEGDSMSIVMLLICVALIGVPVVLIFKTLKGYNAIHEGLRRLREGDTLYKIPMTGSFITNAVSEDINAIGEGLSKAVEKSVRSERMKAELITNVSHDLKTPLTSIINYTDLLMQEKLVPEEANDYVKIIDQKSKKLKQLTTDLFEVSKVRSGNEELELESIDYKLLISQAEAELDSEIKKSGLEFVLNLPSEDITVMADGKKLSRVYENLITNAIKYSLKGTRVYINMKVTDGVYRTEIKNIAGYRMDFDDEEITERFVRGDSSRTGDGSGLGLAIAKSYVELMGGKFYIKTDGDLFKAVVEFKADK